MKKFILKGFLMSAMLTMGMTVQAQSLGNVLGSVLGSSNNSESTDLVSSLTAIFSSKKQASSENIVGTWSYSEPAIVLTSKNVLTQTAAKVAANKMEKTLQTKLTSLGIKPGALTMTFKEDGTFTSTLKGKTTNGKWSVKDSKLQMTTIGIKPVSITTQLSGKEMMFVTDATKLLTLFQTVGAKSTNASLKTVTSLMKSVNGMQVGVTMKKK